MEASSIAKVPKSIYFQRHLIFHFGPWTARKDYQDRPVRDSLFPRPVDGFCRDSYLEGFGFGIVNRRGQAWFARKWVVVGRIAAGFAPRKAAPGRHLSITRTCKGSRSCAPARAR